MSRVDEAMAVRCPFETGHVHLGHFFRVNECADGASAAIPLQVTAAIAGLEKPLSLHRSAIATLTAAPYAAAAEARYRVYWEPTSYGSFPIFTGELFVEAGTARTSLSLRLHGVYTPPPAFLGGGREHIGNLLAVATAMQLLVEIRDFVERDVRIERMRRKSVRGPTDVFDRPG